VQKADLTCNPCQVLHSGGLPCACLSHQENRLSLGHAYCQLFQQNSRGSCGRKCLVIPFMATKNTLMIICLPLQSHLQQQLVLSFHLGMKVRLLLLQVFLLQSFRYLAVKELTKDLEYPFCFASHSITPSEVMIKICVSIKSMTAGITIIRNKVNPFHD